MSSSGLVPAAARGTLIPALLQPSEDTWTSFIGRGAWAVGGTVRPPSELLRCAPCLF